MNLRKLWLSLFAAFFGALMVSTSYAIVIKSGPINNIEVSFVNSSDNTEELEGRIWKRLGNIEGAKKVVLNLVDSKNAIISTKEIELSTEKIEAENLSVGVSLNINRDLLNGKYSLKTKVLGMNDVVLAFGESSKEFSLAEGKSELSKIKNLNISTGRDFVKGLVSFENNDIDGEFSAKIDLYKDGSSREYVGTFNSDKVDVAKGETKEISFSIENPENPQLYEAEVSIMQKDKEVSGRLVGTFMIDGNFGEFYTINVEPKSYIKKGETINIDFTGATTTDMEKTLSVELQVTDNAGFTETKFINVNREDGSHNFAGKEVFLATKDISQLVSKAILWDVNDELAELTLSTELFSKPKDATLVSRIKNIKTGGELTTSDKYKIVGILILILFIIIIFIRGLVRSNKGRNFFIFFGILMISSTTFAANPTGTFYPVDDMAYNPSDSGFFSDLGFWGYVSDPLLGGLFPVTDETIDYDVTISNGSEQVIVTGNFINNNSYEYRFSVDLPAVSASFPEGEYNYVSIRFYGIAIESRLAALGILESGGAQAVDILVELEESPSNPLEIIIDATAPTATFDFTGKNANGYTNSTFGLTPICEDGSGVGCNINFAEFNVTGNFCDSLTPIADPRDFCEDFVHEFKICDIVGNCDTQSSDIDFYDPVKPKTDGGDFIDPNNGNTSIAQNGYLTFSQNGNNPVGSAGNIGGASIALLNGFNFSLLNTNDPDMGNSSSDYTPGNGNTDAHTCSNSSEFHSNGSVCLENESICAISPTVRGVSSDGGLTCTPECPATYTYNVISNFCEPVCRYDRFPYCFNLIIE